MAGADEGRERLTGWSDQSLLKGDAFVAGQHRLTDADQTVAVADRGRDMGDLVPAPFPLLRYAAHTLERFQAEGLDVVGLKPPGFGALHFLTYTVDPARVHGVVGERAFFQQVLELAAVEGVLDDASQTRANVGLL